VKFNAISTAASLGFQRQLAATNRSLAQSLERLSSGTRLNSARDNAAGLQISNRLTSQINGLGIALRNANDGNSVAQTAEGALQESTRMLQRIRELALKSANGSNSDADRTALNAEVGQLKSELDRISDTTTFGGRKLLDGSFGTVGFQVGAGANQLINLSLAQTNAAALTGSLYEGRSNKVELAVIVESAGGQLRQVPFQAGRVDITLGFDQGEKTVSINVAENEDQKMVARKITEAINGASLGVGSYLNSDNSISYVSGAGRYGGSSLQTVKLSVPAQGGLDGIAIFGAEIANAGPGITNAMLKVTNSRVADIDISTARGAQAAIYVADGALKQIDDLRARLGATQNRFDSAVSNLQNIRGNVMAGRSVIRDTDYAAEAGRLSRDQILQQASIAMIAQANQQMKGVLRLLG
jgi:flagellin